MLELDWTYPGEPDSVARFELRPDGDGTILVLDHRGLPPGSIAGYGAGWHSHLDSLDAHLTGGEADWTARFQELGPAYEEEGSARPVDAVDLRVGVLREARDLDSAQRRTVERRDEELVAVCSPPASSYSNNTVNRRYRPSGDHAGVTLKSKSRTLHNRLFDCSRPGA